VKPLDGASIRFCALKARIESSRGSAAQIICCCPIQTFHVWLPSSRRCRGEEQATFASSLPRRRHLSNRICAAKPHKSPQVFFVVFDSGGLHYLDQFFLKRLAPVVFLLIQNIPSYSFDIRRADGDCRIASLPAEDSLAYHVMNPLR
jgi:hypothetical protein